MAIYDELQALIEQLGGSEGPAGIGSINTNGGTETKIKYKAPTSTSGYRNHHVVPYLVGESPAPGSSTPVKRLLAFQYKGPTGQSPDGWRCFKVDDIDDLLPAAPRPAVLPVLDPIRQNCVRTY